MKPRVGLSATVPNDTESIRQELTRARQISRAWSDTIPDRLRIDHGAMFVNVALKSLASKIAPGIELSEPFALPCGRLDTAAIEIARSIGRVTSNLPIAESLHFITSLYPTLLPSRHRGEIGAFYTPQALTMRLLDQATEVGLDWRSARVLDPAVGGGAFLIEAAARMRHALTGCNPSVVARALETRLVGLELDPYAATLAKWSLEILLSDLSDTCGRHLRFDVRVCDSLKEAPQANYDLVVGNPPYGRVTLTSAQRFRFGRSLYGHANLYGVFTDLALRWAKLDGLVAYLTPTSFLSGRYYSALRGLLARDAPPIAIDFVHARRGVFEDVLQETLLAVYRKGASREQRAQIHYLHVTNDLEASVKKNGTIALPPNPTMPWLAPRDSQHSSLIARAETMTARLADWGYAVSTGPLVWNRFKGQLRYEAGAKDIFPLIWAEAVTSDGRFIFKAQKKNHAPFFKINQGDEWLLVDEPCVLVQRTTAKEQARRLIAAELSASFIKHHGSVVVENHLNMVRANSKPLVSTNVVAAVLNSTVVDQLFRCISGSVAVSAFELEALPLPSPPELRHLIRLIERGESRVRIEQEISRLYGVGY